MKKIIDILSGVLVFGIMIGLLAAPIYFLRWYEVIAIHFLCFLISFILSKAVTTRKFKDPQNVYIASILFGMTGLFFNLFEWKKSVNDEVEEIKNKLKHNDESPEFIEFGKNISEGKNHLAIEIFCKNTGLFYCSEKNVPNEFGSPLTEDEIREFLKDKTSDEKLSEILKCRFNIYKGDWESSGYAYFTTKHAVAKIKEYLVQSKKVSLEEFESWFLKNYRQDDLYNDPKDIVTFYEEGYHLSYSSKKDQVKITPLFIYNTLYKECNLFWDSLREIRKDYSEPINPEFNDRVLKPLLYIWENESKEMYFKKSFKIWKEFLFPNETDDNDCGSIEIYGEGSAFLGSNDEVLFNGIKMDLHWLFDEEDGDYEVSGYNLAMSWNGLVANLPKYYDFDFTNGSGEFGTGIGLDGVCKILSELPIIDFNKLSEEEKEDISYIKFPHKDDVIEEKEGEVELNTDLPENWGNDLIMVTTQTKVENESLQESAKAERVKSFCTNCGESISAGDKFCGSCGTKTN